MLKDRHVLNFRFLYSFSNYLKSLFYKPRIYFIYIFYHFAVDFFICFFSFFLILMALKQMDGYENYSFMQNLLFSFIRSFETLLDNINIVALLSCMFFFIKTAKSFNFYILEAFGLTSGKILKPVILFVVLFSFTKIFILRPMCVRLENYKTQKLSNLSVKKIAKVKKGHKFTIVDNVNIDEYMIVSGTYDFHNDDLFKANDAMFLVYKNDVLQKVYTAKQAILKNGKFFLQNVNILFINKVNHNKQVRYSDTLLTQQTIKEIIVKITNTNKIQNAMKLGLYDYISVLLKSHASSIKSSLDVKARIYLSNEIISLFNAILCCLMTFFFCVSPFRNINMAKLALKCFIIYFIILRIFHFFENVIVISNYGAFCVICLAILLCFVMYFFIVDNDWCSNFSNKIKYILCNCKSKIENLFLKFPKKLFKLY